MTIPTPREMQSALVFLEWSSDLPSDLFERMDAVPLSEMTAEQAVTLVTVARLYGWDGE
jgi:hypothetical protein